MTKPISEFVGDVKSKTGGATEKAYRALRPVICAGCGLMIPEGTLFTRIVIPGSGLRISPRCQKCSPFVPRAESEKSASPLIDTLLSCDQGTPDAASPDDAKEVEDAVARRLGPALARARRSGRNKI